MALYIETMALWSNLEQAPWGTTYEEYLPAAKDWIKKYGEISKTEMPHPNMIEKMFFACFQALRTDTYDDTMEEELI